MNCGQCPLDIMKTTWAFELRNMIYIYIYMCVYPYCGNIGNNYKPGHSCANYVIIKKHIYMFTSNRMQ